MSPVIRLDDVTKHYGRALCLDGLSLQVEQGQHDVDADRPQIGTLAGHVRTGHEEERARGAQGHIVADPAARGNQRVPELGGVDSVMRFGYVGINPIRVVMRQICQRAKRLVPADRFQPVRRLCSIRFTPELETIVEMHIPGTGELEHVTLKRTAGYPE